MDSEKNVDEAWKESVAGEKDILSKEDKDSGESGESDFPMEVNFVNYIAGLAFQSMIFLGEIPNPMAEDKIEKNLKQAKFLIDTLILIREKTKGNLTKDEEDLINASVYELQMKYVEARKGEPGK